MTLERFKTQYVRRQSPSYSVSYNTVYRAVPSQSNWSSKHIHWASLFFGYESMSHCLKSMSS